MRVREKIHLTGQSLWLGHVSRDSLYKLSFTRRMEEYRFSGMSLTPQAFIDSLLDGEAYDNSIENKLVEGFTGESLVYQLIYEDVRYAADLLKPVYDQTDGVDGWAVFPVSPLSTADNDTLAEELSEIHAQIGKPNVLLCLPALPNRNEIIEELVYLGVPIIVTNIYSAQQYMKTFQACLTGTGRRIDDGKKLQVSTFISINVSRLGSEFADKLDHQAASSLSVALARDIYRTMREMHESLEWMRSSSAGVRPLRLVWSITDNCYLSKDCRDLYSRLISPLTILELPDEAVDTFIDHPVSEKQHPADGGNYDQVLNEYKKVGCDVEAEATRLQQGYFTYTLKEWALLLESTARKSASLVSAEPSI